ncbi:MAG: toprim domain-containing protein [Sphingopyxis sp.]|uniref:DUF7146 domain-containing protein n=1 Tax=Sphingopyxis sp. TaxID=1908224 RepID=UPI001A5BC992|nr:CHC2 zinc finger domain-containing protein [Sphingopyxis sp.]MBL9065539.1 toprim domain-containing protein [Sphingopyxis sp.]
MNAAINIDAIRTDFPVTAVVGAISKLRRAGREWVACCPLHAERSPSFTIYAGDKRWHCFGCGEGGDVLDLVGKLHGVGLREAAAMLTGHNLPTIKAPRAAPVADNDDRNTISEAIAIWRNSSAISGTPAEAYLRNRGITIRLPDCLRFARIPLGNRSPMPALVALVAGPDDMPCGVQRIYLTDDGRKADLPDGKVKFSLGRIRGGAIRLTPGAVSGMILSGSVEDGLSLVEIEGRAVWAAPGEEMVAGMDLPVAVASVVIGADADMAGRRFAAKALDKFVAEGRAVRVIYPADGAKDFNEELTKGLAA